MHISSIVFQGYAIVVRFCVDSQLFRPKGFLFCQLEEIAPISKSGFNCGKSHYTQLFL